ncbi:MAG: DUF2818 family protein [Alcaligenaceae bacterium]|nr:DUF2818 family protein [Alcaligenaceae bacterium]
MFPASSIWLLILLAFATALLPFLTERAFAFVPWKQQGEPDKNGLFYFLRALLAYVAVGAGCYLLSRPASDTLMLAAGAALILCGVYLPGQVMAQSLKVKTFVNRLIEVTVFFFVVAAVGFALEAYYTNPIVQGWEFWAIFACLYVVMAYPGFVFRHLLKHPKKHKHA